MKQTTPRTLPRHDRTRLVDRPDGFYWQSWGAGREYGPFATLLQAKQDMRDDEEAAEPAQTLEEVWADIGIAGWIDPDTGLPAEEERPRIEEH